MSRRFYVRPTTQVAPSKPARPGYSLWLIPGLVIAGGLLGMTAYWIFRDPPKPVYTTAPRQSVRPVVPPVEKQPEAIISAVVDDAESPQDEVQEAAETTEETQRFTGVRIQVLNGCGVKGLARLITPGLREYGFDVRETRNAGNFDFEHSAIIDRTGDIVRARAIADSLGIDPSQVTSEPAENLVDIDLTLIVGSDYPQLKLQMNQSTRE